MKKLYFTLVTFLFLVVANAQIVNILDPVFKAKLLSANSGNYIASSQELNSSGSVTSYNSIDTNSDGEIQVSEATLIKYLDISSSGITSLDGIMSFINLQSLSCTNNQLPSLNVSGLTNLQNLSCTNNQLTSLNVSGLTNLEGLNCSFNQLPNLNLSGLTNLRSLDCSYNQLQSLNVSGLTYLHILFCSNNQLSSLNVNGFTYLFTLNCSYNQLPSLNISGSNSLQWLNCSNNQLSSLNISGSTVLLQRLNCSYNQLPSLNVSGFTNLENLNCSNNQLTTLFIKASYQYWQTLIFSQNPNLSYVCADEEDITLVQSRINTYGYSTTCHVNSYCSFTPGGAFYTIQGNTKFDNNSNGCDALDYVFPNLKYNISNGTVSGSLISNATGNYSVSVQAGTHTITPQLENPSYFTISPTSASVTFPSTASPFVQNFCVAPNGVHHDLEIVIIPIGSARPGFDAIYKIKYKNKGSVNENATINLNYDDAILDYVSSSLSPTNQAVGMLLWNLGTLTPFQSGEFVVTLNVNSPMETPAINSGDILNYSATISGLNIDETPFDNQAALKQIVVNSVDPNDKTCLEGATISPDKVGEYVHYVIRFENTGTANAQNIVVMDMIDTTKFDIASLVPIDGSHPFTTRITNPNKVEFIFENIQLPFDDANNDGYVVFKIKTKPTLVLGNTFSNTASIYFDYNFPIITNTATTTVSNVLANQDFDFVDYFSISPNPAKDILIIQTKENIEVSSINIYNTLGQLVLLIPNAKDISTIDVSGLKTGNYFIKVLSDKGVSSIKFIKE